MDIPVDVSVVKCGDHFLNSNARKNIRAMHKKLRQDHIQNYIVRAEQKLPLFTKGDQDES